MIRKYLAKRRYARDLMKTLEAVEINGHLEIVQRTYARQYRDIGEGAANLRFLDRNPYQYPGGREAAIKDRLTSWRYDRVR